MLDSTSPTRWSHRPTRPAARFAASFAAVSVLLLALPAGSLPAGPTAQEASGQRAQQPPVQRQIEEPSELRHHTAHHRFDDAERWSRQFDSAQRDAWQKPQEVITLMELAEGMTVADLGAGTGYFLGRLSLAVGPTGSVLGLDLEPAMVEFMTERARREGWPNVEARAVAADDPGLHEGSTDRVLIVNTWHHIEERAAYGKKLRASLVPGGRVYVVDFTMDSPHGPPVSQRLTPEQVIAELRDGGLEASLVEESLPAQYVVVGRRP